MFRKIADKIQYPEWARSWPRYKRLDQFDRLLDGTFYDHLSYAFYDEMDQQQKLILLEDRRPSAQFRLPGMVARWSTRKLFAGRHRPKLRLPGGDAKDAKTRRDSGRKALAPLNGLLRRAKFWRKMAEAVRFGSVGSVAITFRMEGEGEKTRMALYLWRAKYCQPSFDEFGDLAQLRVAYTAAGRSFKALKVEKDADGVDIDDNANYWFIRDYLPETEETYIPPKLTSWNPKDGFTGEGAAQKVLVAVTDLVFEHGLGFVPGHWFVNLPGGHGVDGDCTWEDAIPNSIDMDYTLSQIGRGARYNAAPQLVIKGNLLSDNPTRGPATFLQVQASYKEEDGQTIGEGGAELLEMSGTGTTAALELVDKLRNFALETIAASRKDPDKMKAPLSGRAMEYLDEDSNDLVMELRTQYGEDGALPLIRKIAEASSLLEKKALGNLKLQWPRMFQPTPDEIFALAQAFQIAVDPMGRAQPETAGEPAQPGGSSPTGGKKPGKPAIPPQDATSPEEETEQFITMEEARAYFRLNLDLDMMDADDEGDDESDVDESPTPPDEPTEPVPEPTSIDESVPPGTPEGDQSQTSPSAATLTSGDDE